MTNPGLFQNSDQINQLFWLPSTLFSIGRSSLLKSGFVISYLALVIGHLSAGSEPAIDFRRQIQPILSEHCNLCHGADETARQGGLRLDVESYAYKGGE